ncbi:MAG: hypothetical protein ABIT96_06645 [Ferruginibacter sp.]
MKKILFALCLLGWSVLFAQQTPFELSGGKNTATYQEIIKFYSTLAGKTDLVSLKTMGLTDAYYPLHLVLVSGDGDTNPASWQKKGKTIILINNGIHPGEPDGIDASMMLVRDIIGKKIILPVNIALAIIPVYNIGGCLNRNAYTRANQNGPKEYGFRGNSQNLDLNRDFTKCDSRNAKSFAEIFHFIKPQLFIDNHVSDGADYQHTMTLISTQYEKLGGNLGKFLKETFEPAIYLSMKNKQWDLIPYVDFSSSDFDKGINMFFESPRYSSGYAALFQAISFIPETHMLKPYAQRVQSTYDLMVAIAGQAGKFGKEINSWQKQDQKAVAERKEFVLSWAIDTSHYSPIIFKGYQTSTALSAATGLDKMYFDHTKPYTRNVKFYNTYVPVKTIKAPRAYIIPHGWYNVADLLKLNGVYLTQFARDTLIAAGVYHIDDYKSFPRPYEKHHKNYAVKTSISQEQVQVRKGDYIVYINQPTNKYIVEMLEPEGDDSFFAWNFFDGILQQKEGYSDYRWEDIAAGVIQKDTALYRRLQVKKLADTAFAGNSSAILDYIYRNSPWFEKAYLRYPVYRLD